LVETVKGFATQERTVLEEVTRARASASSIQLTPEALNDPKALERFQAAQNQLSGALSRLLVTVERYPELKSNQNFLALQSQLEGTENRITVERRRFNESVREYNTRLRLFPGSLVARVSGYQAKAFFEAAPDAATVPKVKFWSASRSGPRRRPRPAASADRAAERLRKPPDGRRACAPRSAPDRARASHRYADGDRGVPVARGREPGGRREPALPEVAPGAEEPRQRRAPRRVRRGSQAQARGRIRARGGVARRRGRADHPRRDRAALPRAALRGGARGRRDRG